MISRWLVFVCIAGILILPVYVLGDSADNDTFSSAESVTGDMINGTLGSGEDTDDWYVLEIPPHTSLEVTIRMKNGTANDHILMDVVLEGNGDYEMEMALDQDISEDSGIYQNGRSGFMDLYLHLSGEGGYEVDLHYQREPPGVCLFSIIGMVFVSLIGLVSVLSAVEHMRGR